MPRNVLIPVDGSGNSERAFDFYVSSIRRDDDTILLCHIQTPPTLPVTNLAQPFQFPTEDWTAQVKAEIAKAEKTVAHYVKKCEASQWKKKVLIGSGKPGEAIVAQAKDSNVDLIVIGSRGLNAVRRTFIGSVSDYVIHHTHIPVLVVPPQE